MQPNETAADAGVNQQKEQGVLRDNRAEELAVKIDSLLYDLDPYEYRDQVDDRETNISMIREDLLEENESLELLILGLMDTVILNTPEEFSRAIIILDDIRDFLGEDNPIVVEQYSDWFPKKDVADLEKSSVLDTLHSHQDMQIGRDASASAKNLRTTDKSR